MSCEHKIAQSPCLPHTGNTTQNMAGRLVVGAFRHSSPALLARGLRVAVLRAPCIDHSFASGRLFSRAYSSDVKPPPGDHYRFMKSHEWATLDGNIATVGISDYAQDLLGDVVYVELPDVGMTVKKGGDFSAIESVKAASDIYAPMSGTVTEVNEALQGNAALVNKSPYEEGWIAKLEVSKPDEYQNLLSYQEYTDTLEKDDS